MCMCALCVCVSRGQKRVRVAEEPLEVELHTYVSCLVWVLGFEPESWKSNALLTAELSFQLLPHMEEFLMQGLQKDLFSLGHSVYIALNSLNHVKLQEVNGVEPWVPSGPKYWVAEETGSPHFSRDVTWVIIKGSWAERPCLSDISQDKKWILQHPFFRYCHGMTHFFRLQRLCFLEKTAYFK